MDGMAFMEYGVVWDGEPSQGGQEISLSSDYAAILWMQDNIQGSPVILEGLGYREYLWANRVSIYTGLPSVVGWRWHEVQQYAALPSQLVEYFPKMLAQYSIDLLLTSLRDENHMILAIPPRVI